MAEYRIIVDFNGGGDGYKSPNSEKPKLTDEQVQEQQLSSSIFGFAQKGVNAFSSLATVATVVDAAKTIFSYEVHKVGRYTGSQQAQDVANAALSIAGMIFNPIGSALNIAFEQEERRYERQWENIGLNLYRERGGVSLNRSRSEV